LVAGRHLQKWVGAPSGPSNRKLNPQLSRYVFASRRNGGMPPQFFSSTMRDQSDPVTAAPFPPSIRAIASNSRSSWFTGRPSKSGTDRAPRPTRATRARAAGGRGARALGRAAQGGATFAYPYAVSLVHARPSVLRSKPR